MTEILIAIAVLGIVLTPMYLMEFRSARTVATAEDVTLATIMANNLIAKYENLPFGWFRENVNGEYTDSGVNGRFKYTVTVKRPYNGDESVAAIVVRVDWRKKFASKNDDRYIVVGRLVVDREIR